jgi:hypothetical protein
MNRTVLAILISLLSGGALASTFADETANTDQPKDATEPAAATDAKKDDELKLPPGFKAKKRGDITLYCIKGKATGTRFQTESCYDRAQLQDYLLAREQNNRDFDQARAVCQTAAVCQIR